MHVPIVREFEAAQVGELAQFLRELAQLVVAAVQEPERTAVDDACRELPQAVAGN
jgi:hypothetical protein